MKEIDETTLRDLWEKHGGRFHGPKIEHGFMEESKLLPFLQMLQESTPEPRKAPDISILLRTWATELARLLEKGTFGEHITDGPCPYCSAGAIRDGLNRLSSHVKTQISKTN